MPRPRSTDAHAIARSALRIIERDGLGALSIRAIAEDLGLRPMALYRYVDGRDEIEQLVVDLITSDAPSATNGTWADRVALLVDHVCRAAQRHPDAVPLLLTRRHGSQRSHDWGEAVLGALTDGGLDGESRVLAFRTIQSYLYGSLTVQRYAPLEGRGTKTLSELPPDTYPLLARTAADARHVSEDDEFRYGLRLVLTGLGGALTGEADGWPTTPNDQGGPT